MTFAKFDSKRAKKFILDTVDFRVPEKNELYINKFGKVQRCKQTNYSRYSQDRIIVKESWK